jgi:hypothetical protein
MLETILEALTFSSDLRYLTADFIFSIAIAGLFLRAEDNSLSQLIISLALSYLKSHTILCDLNVTIGPPFVITYSFGLPQLAL